MAKTSLKTPRWSTEKSRVNKIVCPMYIHRWWGPILCLSHPDNLTRLLASTKNADLEWTQFNFLRFMSLQNTDFVLPLVSVYQFMVHKIVNVKLILSLAYIK